MKIIFSSKALEELASYRTSQPKLAFKVLELIQDIEKHPFEGLGKPEPLKGNLKGFGQEELPMNIDSFTPFRKTRFTSPPASIITKAFKDNLQSRKITNILQTPAKRPPISTACKKSVLFCQPKKNCF